MYAQTDACGSVDVDMGGICGMYGMWRMDGESKVEWTSGVRRSSEEP
jgi:hypothetical protein